MLVARKRARLEWKMLSREQEVRVLLPETFRARSGRVKRACLHVRIGQPQIFRLHLLLTCSSITGTLS